MNNAAALYFKDEFGQSTESAAAIASIFGWMNLFARGLGGWASDKANIYAGMRGRIFVHAVCLLGEGVMVFVFANSNSLGIAIFVLTVFSLFVQAAEGTSFGIVPYIDPPSTGSISGVVGAGGNVGAVLFGLGFRQLDYYQAFVLMGCCILLSAASCALIYIKGHSALFCGQDTMYETTKGGADGVLVVPEKDDGKILDTDEIEEIEC
jgi:MFS transporter, NNP family, nitrate/nitrite transporter